MSKTECVNRTMIPFIAIVIYFAILSPGASAQDSVIFDGHRHKIGFITGYGSQYALNVPYDYKVCFLQAQYNYSLLRKQSWSFEIQLQPQFNLTRYRPVNDSVHHENGYEYGLNVALLFRKNFRDDLFGLYIFIGTGPHYISGAPQRQTNGFIFSDNLFIGINIKLSEHLFLDVRPGIRHISNAGIENPNGGVNTAVISGGIFYTL